MYAAFVNAIIPANNYVHDIVLQALWMQELMQVLTTY